VLAPATPGGAAIYGIDREGKCTFATAACLKLLGYQRPADLVGRNLHQLIHHSRADGTPNPIEACIPCQSAKRGDESRCDDEVLWRGDGEMIPVQYHCHPFLIDDGPVGAVVEVVVEPRSRQLQAQMIETARLIATGELLPAFVHQIRQPLNVIMMASASAAELVEDGAADREFLLTKFERIGAQTQRAAAIVDRVQVLGQKPTGEPLEFDPVVAVEGALALFEEQLRLRSVEVSFKPPEHRLKVLGHPVLLEQALVSVIAKARDAVCAAPAGAAPEAQDVRREIDIALGDLGSSGSVDIIVKAGSGDRVVKASATSAPPTAVEEIAWAVEPGLASSAQIIANMGGTIEGKEFSGGMEVAIGLPVATRRPRTPG